MGGRLTQVVTDTIISDAAADADAAAAATLAEKDAVIVTMQANAATSLARLDAIRSIKASRKQYVTDNAVGYEDGSLDAFGRALYRISKQLTEGAV